MRTAPDNPVGLGVPPVRRARGEMLPLLDMIFLLLVLFIFMIVQMRPDFGVSVDVPEVDEAAGGDAGRDGEKAVVVAVRRNNSIVVNDTPATMDNVVSVLRLETGDAPAEKLSIILRGDSRCDYGRVIQLFDRFRRERLGNVTFDVDVRNPARAGADR